MVQRVKFARSGVTMAFDEALAARIREALARRRNVEEKKMFGCLCFLLSGNALAGVWKDRLIARLGPDEGEAALREPHVRAFDITGRPMRKWVAVEPAGVEGDEQLKDWIDLALKWVRTVQPRIVECGPCAVRAFPTKYVPGP